MSTFTGFSEEDLKRIKSSDSGPNSDIKEENLDPVQQSDTIVSSSTMDKSEDNASRKSSSTTTPDVVRCVENYTEDDLASHRAKLEELQLKQKLMEEQNKKRKEMLAKALADRTKQTEEEVQKLEKIKKELQVLDGQFSQDVAVLRKKIDQACLSYADAEKHYLKVEKEFLQAKISLQKERERKELLTEHLCALITHNETRKAQKLETLMLELASNKTENAIDVATPVRDTSPVIIDGVDERTGKMVEIMPES
ncbi:RAB6-interacting golgin isoform X2 [Bicyclus anynana]|uniref:RAB6-interacting golgin n=1 Tax=Bicyclus anynana TaxID=110368 RepID=A0ABM3LS84_BICAN|nr:RAB6-interacting golgin isoform X2 [Bicyclus anynana]